ncbi:MAG: arginine--tRNA ligase [Deltaproteobacteria bacterium]|nr:arginine--tRNA ligase [Deltaproteobacteria bacterium]
MAAGLLPAGERPRVQLDAPKQAAHGDFACNSALVLQKQHAAATGAQKPNPRALAQAIVERLKDPEGLLSKVEIAGPGFLNLTLTPAAWHNELKSIEAEGAKFGRSNAGGGKKTMVEFVSANPTGPMHVGHGRGAVIGDTVASLLDWAGYAVTREFYVNDAGGQVFRLGHAVLARATEIAQSEGIEGCAGAPLVPLDPEDYQGEYVKDVSRAWLLSMPANARLAALTTPFEQQKEPLRKFSTDWVITNLIKEDLKLFNIRFDVWFSEKTLHDKDAITAAVEELKKKGVLAHEVLEKPADQKKADKTAKATAAHEAKSADAKGEAKVAEAKPDAKAAEAKAAEPTGHGDDEPVPEGKPLLVMKTTRFGDDRDRPIYKTSGEPTYFAADVAYHWDKLSRGYSRMVNVWGADHGGYVSRMKAAVKSMGGELEVILFQLVNLLKDGQPFKMSKRAANFVTLRELLEEAGADATRFFFLLRRGDMALDFDVALAKKNSSDNPVFYVQYGHARCCAILRKAQEEKGLTPKWDAAAMQALTLPEELEIARRLLAFPELVASAAEALEPHRVVFYLQETIAQFHGYYTKYKKTERVITDDAAKTQARLYLVWAVAQVLKNGLALLGVSAPERMQSDAPEAEGETAEA